MLKKGTQIEFATLSGSTHNFDVMPGSKEDSLHWK